ncbi:NFACT family protein [Candidatus Woesearchaeota archaeon]|nr:NFACT family protein [Candidatus Woesearchaeota archaeon]MCF7900800.1 NFACT family protein [Candidatus Woesearchaeota archaeon]MCF8013102.1 NFACT family protein [Candidatus Woesearchaeota archaeon]
MVELSGLDIHYVVEELKLLENSKIDKIYQIENNKFIFRLRTKEGKKELIIELPTKIYLNTKNIEMPQEPPQFCQYLRKYLQNNTLEKIDQKDFERIIEIKTRGKDGQKTLILELFKPGNIILLNEEEIIMNCLSKKKFKDRKVVPKEKYLFPPLQKNPKKLTEKEICKILTNTEKTLGAAIATELSFGGKYAQEICYEIDKTKHYKELSNEEKQTIQKNIKEIFKREIKPNTSENKPYPFIMKTKKAEKEFNTFSETIQSTETKQTKSQEKKNKKLERIQRTIDQQEKRIQGLKIEIDENQKKGEFIYENYQKLNTLLEKSKQIMNEKGMLELENALKEMKEFKSLNKKEKKIKLDI